MAEVRKHRLWDRRDVPRRVRGFFGSSESGILVIGEAPSQTMEARGEPQHACCSVARLAGVPTGEFARLFARTNVLPRWPGKSRGGKGDAFPLGEARVEAERLLSAWGGKFAKVVLLGRRVARAFGIERGWFEGIPSDCFVVVPHPSGVSRWRNVRENRRRELAWWRALVEEARERRAQARMIAIASSGGTIRARDLVASIPPAEGISAERARATSYDSAVVGDSILLYAREVPYLSQSRLRAIEEAPAAFWREHLAPEAESRREPQTYPMAVGCAFDSHVKSYLARRLGLPFPQGLRAHLDRYVVAPERRDEAIAHGAWLMVEYARSGALEATALDRPVAVELELGPVALPNGVPLHGHPDCFVAGPAGGGAGGPLDWKVSGANDPKSPRAPRPGYVELWEGGVNLGPHEWAGRPFEEVDEHWATQLACYGLLLGADPKLPISGAIDELVCGKEGRVRVARFRSRVSPEFVARVLERLAAAWAAVRERRLLPPGTTAELARVL